MLAFQGYVYLQIRYPDPSPEEYIQNWTLASKQPLHMLPLT